jgi:hypothetical protein
VVTVVSVGPYELMKRAEGATIDAHARTLSIGVASPPVMNTRSDSGSARRRSAMSCIHCCQSADGRSRIVSAFARHSSRMSSFDSSLAGSASTTVAPLTSAGKIWNADTSNPIGAKCRNRSPGRMPVASTTPRQELTSARCGTMTPFGAPVDPDV